MLVIRFLRVGKINQPSFKIVVTEKKNPPRGGRFVEELGNYNPLTKEKILKKERIQYWMSQGAQPSPTVYNLLIREGILEGSKIRLHKKPKKIEAASPLPGAGEPRPAEAGREKPPEAKKEEAPKKEEKPAEPPKEEVLKKEETPKKEEKPKEEK